MADHTESNGKSLQVIIMGAGGGPLEDNCTAFLVRSLSVGWTKESILAVDTGVHLSAIERLLQEWSPSTPTRPHTLSEGPLAGLELPCKSPGANTQHITRNLIGAHLITHAHLDHISGGIISTASPTAKPRRIAGLASTIEALKNHIFNDIIWPNVSDENGGVGSVTYMRMLSGGSSFLGDGVTKGYTEVIDGIGVKSWAVSHGNCVGNFPYGALNTAPESPRNSYKRLSIHSHRDRTSPITPEGLSKVAEGLSLSSTSADQFHVHTSSAFFIHDIASGQEILIWGDVEPDSISDFPRNKQVWVDAAPKVAAGTLKAIFIECAFDNSRPDEILFGHLTPRYVIEELQVLADETQRHRDEILHGQPSHERGSISRVSVSSYSSRSTLDYLRKSCSAREKERGMPPALSTSTSYVYANRIRTEGVLRGVKVVLIHIKDTLDDKEDVRKVIMREILEHEEQARLGCEFVMSQRNMSLFL